MRARMALAMSVAGIVPVVICHLLFWPSFEPVYLLWYAMLLAAIAVSNWFLADWILRPFHKLLQSATDLATMDIHQRLEAGSDELVETAELRQSFNRLLNRLEESLNIQCQFVADASHELRTPLTSIQGYTKLLQRRGANIDSNLLSESLQTISDESGRLIRLVSDLLQLARADAGQEVISKKEILDLQAVVSGVEDTVSVIAPEQIEIQFVLPEQPVWVYADGDRLKQVYLNLINNAIKATQSGGKVTVTLRQSGSEAVVKIIDTGIGIAPADQQRIFDRFYRIERSRTRSRLYGGGSGLGLAIALTILKAHGGSIHLESELNKGSTFTVKLPIANNDLVDKVQEDSRLQSELKQQEVREPSSQNQLPA